ncbi:DUF2599 domain-containing protein [Tsukamurella sp. DT100]|uniref:DUF2599 domain-containing protein n=1 Tax=Tsukamurella sp. DT100 TaxID=3393415 RepID=UPI003CF5B290
MRTLYGRKLTLLERWCRAILALVVAVLVGASGTLAGSDLLPAATALPCPDGSQTCGPQPTQDPGPTQGNQVPTTAPQAPQTTIPPNTDTGGPTPPTNGNPGFQGTVQAMPTPDNPSGCIVNCGPTQTQAPTESPTPAQASPTTGAQTTIPTRRSTAPPTSSTTTAITLPSTTAPGSKPSQRSEDSKCLDLFREAYASDSAADYGLDIATLRGGSGRSVLTWGGGQRWVQDPTDGDRNIPDNCSCHDMPRVSISGPSSGDGCEHKAVERVNWVIPDSKTDEKGRNMLQLVPTQDLRNVARATPWPSLLAVDDPLELRNWASRPAETVPYLAWREFKCQALAMGVPEDIVNTKTVFQQYLCHFIGVEKLKPGKQSWNFEPQMVAAGTYKTSLARCNL